MTSCFNLFTVRASRTAAVILLLIVCLGQAPGQQLVSGEPMKVVVNGGVGVLAAPDACVFMPMGWATVYGGERPDLFAAGSYGFTKALYLYRWRFDNERGQAVFTEPVTVKSPFHGKNAFSGHIFQDDAGVVHGYWVNKNLLMHHIYHHEKLEFEEVARLDLGELPPVASMLVSPLENGDLEVSLGEFDGKKYKPEGDLLDPAYTLYDATGSYRGEFPRVGFYRLQVKDDLSAVTQPPQLYSRSTSEILSNSMSLTPLDLGPDGPRGVLAGARLGNLLFFAAPGGDSDQLAPKRALFGPGRHSLRHLSMDAYALSYPNREGRAIDLIVGGQGALYYYRFTGEIAEGGHPVYGEPEPIWQENAKLYFGSSLPVPAVADWDGDGALDLIVGNSEGFVEFFKNHGSNREPAFGFGQKLTADDELIHEQPGYYGIQGPFEARWGYTCPNVADWNGDGLPDLLLSGSKATHQVFLNIGGKTKPKLARGRPLYCDGLELHGTWRVRPGVARIDGRMTYVIQDDDDALHLYWRIDDYNVEDGGTLTLADNGQPITGYMTGDEYWPGLRGRAKIDVTDWDSDGKLDLLIGTIKRGSFPEPNDGLPWRRTRNKELTLQVLLLRNVGSNVEPRYEYPRQFQFRGKDIYLGAHSNAPVACELGDTSNGPNMLIGMESGHIYYFDHNDMTLAPTATTEIAQP
ncbi:MAG: VCBS repeat-containing protein [Phycisphaeraceae bacterium]|nr:VCBS repeat-containing protein [Phycisphaeraceae bacterium]